MRPNRENMRGGAALMKHARHLRREMTEAERLLWRELRRKRFGWRFHRQFPIPPYIADFACIEAHLIVECDGGQHGWSSDDERRDAALHRQGWRVLRFWNNDIFANLPGVLQTLVEALGPWSATDCHPSPPPLAGEGEPTLARKG